MLQSRALRQGAVWPTKMAELTRAEKFIVWCFRRWVLGLRENNGGHWSLVWNEFARQLGARDGKDALSNFANLINGLHGHARRKIHHHQPCCPCLGADEAWVIGFLAACQNRRPILARSLAEWMVEPDGAGEVLDAGYRLAQVMRRRAVNLPQRTGGSDFATASAPHQLAGVTFH